MRRRVRNSPPQIFIRQSGFRNSDRLPGRLEEAAVVEEEEAVVVVAVAEEVVV
jgi:hypothetical protein